MVVHSYNTTTALSAMVTSWRFYTITNLAVSQVLITEYFHLFLGQTQADHEAPPQ